MMTVKSGLPTNGHGDQGQGGLCCPGVYALFSHACLQPVPQCSLGPGLRLPGSQVGGKLWWEFFRISPTLTLEWGT